MLSREDVSCCANPGDRNCPLQSYSWEGSEFHTGPVLGLALSGTGDVSLEVDLSPAGWVLWGMDPTALWVGTDPSRAPAALPSAAGAGADAVRQSHHQDRTLVGSLG